MPMFQDKTSLLQLDDTEGYEMPSKPRLSSEVGWTSTAVLVPSLWEEAVFCAEGIGHGKGEAKSRNNMEKIWKTKNKYREFRQQTI